MSDFSSSSSVKAFRARWVIPVATPPVRDGVVLCRDGYIVDVGPANRFSEYRPVDLGAVALIPGLINAHTHLEFSDLQKPLGTPGIPFTDWIAEVVRYRIASGSDDLAAKKIDGYRLGMLESIRCGVVAVGEISSSPYLTSRYAITPPSSAVDGVGNDVSLLVTAFLEVLGRQSELIDQKLKGMHDEFKGAAQANGQLTEHTRPIRLGVSPHAPYSVHPQLLKGLVQQSIDKQLPIAMHLAETREELQLMHSQDGPFVDLLKSLGAWFPETYQHRTVRSYLECLALAPHALLVHGNYLGDSDIEFIARHADRMHVVFCPRTHEYFGHTPHPFPQMLGNGVNVAIGTDSRASNPDLNLYSELKAIADNYPEVSPMQILSMGTLGGARALQSEDQLGTIEKGKLSRLSVVRQSNGADNWPLERLFEGECCLLNDHLAGLA